MPAIGFIDSNGLPHTFEELREPGYKHDRTAWGGLPKGPLLMLARKPRVRTSDVSVSELCGDPQQQLLKLRHEYYVKPDDQLWSVWGTGLHKAQEEAYAEGEAEITFRWKDPSSGLLVGCRADAIEDGVLWDTKTTSYYGTKEVAREGLKAKPEWVMQLKLNCALAHLSEADLSLHTAGVVAYTRDWRPKESQTIKGYPPKQVVATIPINLDESIALLLERLKGWVAAKDLHEAALPNCSDLWRPLNDGRPSRCVNYCEVRQFCLQYRSRWGA